MESDFLNYVGVVIFSVIKVLKHISFARDWLDRAEEKIRNGSFIDGEVYLSLAESEVRKAWEDSYSSRKRKKKIAVKRRHLSLVMGIILILGFVFIGTSHLYTPVNQPEQFKLSLSDGYRNMENMYSESQEVRLINVDFMLDKNYDRGQ